MLMPLKFLLQNQQLQQQILPKMYQFQQQQCSAAFGPPSIIIKSSPFDALEL
jgi:hypothetical protein